jgi:hypothetical protein
MGTAIKDTINIIYVLLGVSLLMIIISGRLENFVRFFNSVSLVFTSRIVVELVTLIK